jgi:hypothetical protein
MPEGGTDVPQLFSAAWINPSVDDLADEGPIPTPS